MKKRLGTTGLRNVLIIISRGLTVGDGKTRMAIQLDKLQKAIMSLNKYERCTFQSQNTARMFLSECI